MDSPAVQQRIKDLAKTLRSTGIAASETRAEEMARDIVRTELRQQERLDTKRNDPSLNPQQRTGSTPKNVSYSIDESISQEKPISELLAEDVSRENTSAFKRPESFSVEQTPDEDVVEVSEQEEALKASEPSTHIQPVMQKPIQEPKQVLEPAKQKAAQEPKPEQPRPVQQAPESQPAQPQQAPSQPAPPLQGGNSAQKAFGLLLNSATQQEANRQKAQTSQQAPEKPEPAKQEAPTQPKPAEKKPENKVDLSEMFNFSKR